MDEAANAEPERAQALDTQREEEAVPENDERHHAAAWPVEDVIYVEETQLVAEEEDANGDSVSNEENHLLLGLVEKESIVEDVADAEALGPFESADVAEEAPPVFQEENEAKDSVDYAEEASNAIVRELEDEEVEVEELSFSNTAERVEDRCLEEADIVEQIEPTDIEVADEETRFAVDVIDKEMTEDTVTVPQVDDQHVEEINQDDYLPAVQETLPQMAKMSSDEIKTIDEDVQTNERAIVLEETFPSVADVCDAVDDEAEAPKVSDVPVLVDSSESFACEPEPMIESTFPASGNEVLEEESIDGESLIKEDAPQEDELIEKVKESECVPLEEVKSEAAEAVESKPLGEEGSKVIDETEKNYLSNAVSSLEESTSVEKSANSVNNSVEFHENSDKRADVPAAMEGKGYIFPVTPVPSSTWRNCCGLLDVLMKSSR